jgi:SP family galactose:H+ symporter-like MFS transporter
VSAARGHWSDLWAPAVRPALTAGVGAILQQITGINTVTYYAPTIIQSAGIPSASGAILSTVGVGIVNVIMTGFPKWLIDRAGRRPLLPTGIAGMIVTLGVLGSAFAIYGGLPWVAEVCLMAYVASFAISLGPIFWLLISEIYPMNIRGVAQGGGCCQLGSEPPRLAELSYSPSRTRPGPDIWLYRLLAIGAWFFFYCLVPQTKGRTLEQIEQAWRTDRVHNVQS